MTENPPPPPGTPEGGGSTPPPPPPNPYSSQPPPPSDPYAGNPPAAGQSPYGSAPPPPPAGQNPYGAASYPVSNEPPPVAGAQPAGLGVRFGARIIDGVLVAIVQIIIALLTNSIVGGVIGGIIYLAYYVYMESSRGSTLGKQWLGMRVHGAAGGNPSMEESLRRNAWAALGIITSIPVLGFLIALVELAAVIAIAVTINSDPFKRGWHDKFGNTSVTRGG
jgi:uncharacterized RDD family membrane protein YckC